MPEVQEVFRMATQKVRPDPGALERQRHKQRWRIGRQKATVYALAAGLVIGGVLVGISVLRDTEERPGTPGQEEGGAIGGAPPTVEGLTGVWLSEAGSGIMAEFAGDGTWIHGDGGGLYTDPWARGTFSINGRTITLEARSSAEQGGYFCIRVDAGLFEDGRLETIAREDPDCLLFAGTERNFIRVSPRSPAAAAITADVPEDGWGPLPLGTGSTLRGIWLLEGDDHLLSLRADGTYALDGDGTLATDPDDVGTFEVDGEAGTITFTSGAESGMCAGGDVATWSDGELARSAFRTEVQSADCAAHGGLTGTWIRISS